MRFVLDNSVAMRWLLPTGARPRKGLPLATLDADLRSALTTTGGQLA
ncbi:MAG: hypothetical protein IPO00_15870 [Betaproteobacteria bacterium]|nr:hypothetical protein [Betaproteobacteria bacterium]